MPESSNKDGNANTTIYDVVIVGGGVVGISILRAVTLSGLRCALLEQNSELLDAASGRNSGIVCTGVDASPGTLERSLIRDAISDMRIFCKEMNVPMRECGSLVCLWPWDKLDSGDITVDDKGTIEDTKKREQKEERDNGANRGDDQSQMVQEKLRHVALESWEAGDTHAAILSPPEVLRLEPHLYSEVRGAVHIPGEIVIDPWLYSIALASHARENGATIHTSFAYNPSKSYFDEKEGIWTLVRSSHDNETNGSETTSDFLSVSPPKTVKARIVVNAAGIQSDLIQAQTNDAPPPTWEARPRRGQYRIYAIASPLHSKRSSHDDHDDDCGDDTRNTVQLTHPIQPVPTQRTKGIFVFSSLYDQIIVGPTALDQISRTDDAPSSDVARELDEHVKRILPSLNVTNKNNLVGEYVGIRPGTDQRDYQIQMFPKRHWVVASGIRSTGLTASLGIGRYALRLIQSMGVTFSSLDNGDGGTTDVKDNRSPTAPTKLIKRMTTPLPDVEKLVEDYHQRGDGKVCINGWVYKVTHPITRLGWERKAGLASS